MQSGADSTLIEASRRGDRDAFAQIVGRYQRAVYAVAFAGVRDRALADDVVQDTFVIAWRRLDELRDDQRLAAWLCGIARNRARMVRRQSHRETAGDLEAMPHATTPFDEMTEAESERIIAAALGLVPDVYREPLVLYYYEERSIDDVARSLGISAATTNKRLSRGRRFLAERVATVERALTRRGPAPGLAASVIAAIAVPAPHVDSPALKGSIMHKLAIAAIATLTAGGVGALIITTTRNSASAATQTPSQRGAMDPSAHASTTTSAASAHGKHGALCDLMSEMHHHGAASKPTAAESTAAALMAGDSNDCAAVGQHLADLQADATHGPDSRPDEQSFTTCASTYQSICERESWTAERRACTIAAGDLINAHLCAGHVTAAEQPSAIPANLACAVVGPKIATTLQSAGFHEDITDLGDQIAAACDVGNWTLDLRTCLAGALSVDALKSCIHDEVGE